MATRKASAKKTTKKTTTRKKATRKKAAARRSPRRKAVADNTQPEFARRDELRFSRVGNPALTPLRAKRAASAKLKPERSDALNRWFSDPLHSDGEYATLREAIEGQARRYGDKAFLIYEENGREYSYRDLNRETSLNVNLFRKLGADEGAKIGILDANTPDFVFLYLGCMKGAYTSAPLNYHLKAPELHFCLENSESQLLFVSLEYFAEIEKILEELHFLKAVCIIADKLPKKLRKKCVQNAKDFKAAAKAREEGSAPLLVDFRAFRGEMKARIPTSHPKPSADTAAEIIYTSGTTGKPKGVILRHHQFLTDARYIARWYRMSDESRMMMVLPLFHVNAEVVTTCTPLVAGGSVVMFKKFSASRFWPAVQKHGVNIVSVVPTILTILTRHEKAVLASGKKKEGNERGNGRVPDRLKPYQRESRTEKITVNRANARKQGAAWGHDLRTLQTIICGAAPLPAEVQLEFEETFLIPITEGYGLSETTCYSTFNPIEGNRKVATIGVEVGNQVNTFDGELQSTRPGEMGEIVIRGENVMLEYYKRAEANVEAFAGGWFHSGDVGEFDVDGFLRIRDRVKDMIIRGGENIYPREIDEVLYTHPAIVNAATIGVPDEKYGEEVVSFVVLEGATIPTGKKARTLEEDILAYCKERLADYKVPRSVRFIAEIPKGPTGKLLRRALREMA